MSAPRPPIETLLLAIVRDSDAAHDFGVNLTHALDELPAFLDGDDGIADSVVQEAAERILDRSTPTPFWRDAHALHRQIQMAGEPVVTLSREDQATLSRYGYQVAGAAFALGFAAGLRFGGAR